MVRSMTSVRDISEYSLNQKLSIPAFLAFSIQALSAVDVARMILIFGLFCLIVRAQVRPSSPRFIITSMITRSTGCSEHQAIACSALEREATSSYFFAICTWISKKLLATY